MKKLLLLLLLPSLLFGQSKYKIFTGEYDCYAVNPLDGKLYNVVMAGIGGKPAVVAGDPGVIDGSASLHTAAFIGKDQFAYVIGDNFCNISGLGLKGSTIGLTKTGIGNVKQVVAYANSGNGPTLPAQQGLGYGIAIVTNDGKLTLIGNTQSGFRGDGTEGNVAETSPYLVTTIIKPIQKVAIGSFVYVLYTDGTVDSWGGTRLQYYPTYVLGRGADNPDPTRPGAMKFPEPIVDLVGGGNWTLFKGQSGAIYGVAYNTRYLGLGPNVAGQNTPFNLTKTLGLPGIPVQLATGPQASYALMANGDAYAWGDNTQAAIGNGQEATFSNFVAPWGGGALWVDKPVKINPAGVVFVKLFTSIGDAFYVYAEDSNGNLWVWGRNKGFVLWNGQGSTDGNVQANQPNKWDVLAPMQIFGFGAIVVTPPPNKPPTAVISNAAALTWPANGVQLNGSLSWDSDGLIASYRWSSQGSAISDTAAKSPIMLFPGPGSYYVMLVVTDNKGATGLAQVTVTVNPPVICPVCPPIPAPRTVTGATVHLNGIGYSAPMAWMTFTYSDGTTQ